MWNVMIMACFNYYARISQEDMGKPVKIAGGCEYKKLREQES
jgi:hypothetical protein